MENHDGKLLDAEWSHWIHVDHLKNGTTHFDISPEQEDIDRLVRRLGIVAIKKLDAHVDVSKQPGAVSYHVNGRFNADVVQECVVSGTPVDASVRDEFEGWFSDLSAATSISKARHQKELEKGFGEIPMLDESDDPEALVDGKIDLGELVTQYLSLALDPYPHAPDVEFDDLAKEKGLVSEGADIKNPFAALKDWKDKLSDNENS